MSPSKSMIALLLALGATAASAQNQVQQPPTGKPVDDSASYGPVLNPQTPPATTVQPTTSSTQAAGESRPQAQEERAGMPPTSKQTEVDPSARPAPAAVQPEPSQPQPRQQGTRQQQQQQQPRPPQANRRAVEQRIAPTPRIAAPATRTAPAAQATVTPPTAPRTSQLVGCTGGVCTDANGTTYNASGPSNAGVSRDGRLCTSNGVTVQCL